MMLVRVPVRSKFAVSLLVGITLGVLSTAPARAEVKPVSFERDIQPIFTEHCLRCHGPEKQTNGLRLDWRTAALRGGDSGEPAIIPGNSGESHLMRAVRGVDGVTRMPKDGAPLSDEQIALLARWIDAGAGDWPAAPGEVADDPGYTNVDLWSLKPVESAAPPKVSNAAWVRNGVDAFILHRLEERGLTPSPQADRATLIRRLHFTLHGLPPTPEAFERYASDARPDWYERMVEDLLASPRYGERWARHWLDVARYAETNGFETNTPRGNAWHYRDYVIRAFNADKPYDRFILDQLAGDTTGEPAATGFIVAGPWDEVKSPDPVLTATQRSNELADIINATSGAFLGLTVACARCHHHKFDPVLQSDYYAMEAVFAGVLHGEQTHARMRTPDQEKRRAELTAEIARLDLEIDRREPLAVVQPRADDEPHRMPVNALRNVERFAPVRARFIRMTIDATLSGAEPCIDELEVFRVGDNRNVALASGGAVAHASGEYPHADIHRIAYINDGRYGNAHSWIPDTRDRAWIQIDLPEPATIDRIVWARDRLAQYADRVPLAYRIEVAVRPGEWQVVASAMDRATFGNQEELALVTSRREAINRLETRRGKLTDELAALTRPIAMYAGVFVQPQPTHRLYRGDPMAKREVVAPDALSILGTLDLAVNAPEQQRRVALAKWIGSRENPLTARVMVNRLWLYHFGQGLVDTPSDFGGNGARPTHPALLDYLATEFMRHDWSIKHMHRLIVLSNTYRQAGTPDDAALNIDADTRLLWRFPPRRLEAEVIRDAMLQTSGKLDLTMGGPGFSFFKPNNNYVRVYEPKEQFGPADWRRMIYATHVRMEKDATFGAFDCPDAGQPTAQRPRSTTALQALNLLNSPFVLQQAAFLAQRLRDEAGDNVTDQVTRAFVLAFNRRPDAEELSACTAFIHAHDLDAFCRVLFNTSEFLFVE